MFKAIFIYFITNKQITKSAFYTNLFNISLKSTGYVKNMSMKTQIYIRLN